MNDLQEQFYQAMTNLRANKSRAASVTRDDVRVTEIINGVLVSRPAATIKKEPEVIDLQEYAKSKAASVQGINNNKAKVIANFIASNGNL
jgi:hypothetical protein